MSASAMVPMLYKNIGSVCMIICRIMGLSAFWSLQKSNTLLSKFCWGICLMQTSLLSVNN